MTVCIKRMTAQDVEFVKALEEFCCLSSWSAEDYLAETGRPDSISLVVKKNNIRCGFIIARLIMNKEYSEIEIYNMAIVPSDQGQTLGSILLTELVNRSSAFNHLNIHLEVRKSNTKAFNFYKKNGFTEIGKRKNFYTNPNEDAILMCRANKK